MTYSIVAVDPETRKLGVGVVTGHFAVGAFVPVVRAGIGAAATQADTNPVLGRSFLRRLAEGQPPGAALAASIGEDAEPGIRQIHGLSIEGATAAYTGQKAPAYAGHLTASGVSVAGNILAGPQVIEAMLASFLGGVERPFHRRLLAALLAGQDAGGDKRGQTSAALIVANTHVLPELDIRIDYSPAAVSALAAAIDEWEKPYVQEFIARLRRIPDEVAAS